MTELSPDAIEEARARSPEPSPITRVLTRPTGTLGIITQGPEGIVWPPQQPLSPEPEEPEEPVEEIQVDPGLYGTPEGILLAEGWQPPRPDLHGVLLRLEAIGLAIKVIKVRAVQDFGLISEAVAQGDVAAIVATSERNGLDMFFQTQTAEGSPLETLRGQLQWERNKLLWRHRDSVLLSLAGRHSPMAERLRTTVRALAKLPTEPTWNDCSRLERQVR